MTTYQPATFQFGRLIWRLLAVSNETRVMSGDMRPVTLSSGINSNPKAQIDAATMNNAVKPPACPKCGTLMTLVAVIPKFRKLPEIQSFKCQICAETLTRKNHEA